MNESWYQDYVLLAHHIQKVLSKFTDNPFIDAYYGPPEWKTQADNEPEMPTAHLVKAAMALADALSAQNFASRHANYLRKQVVAMETISRKLDGQTFSLEEEVQGCFDIRPTRIPESQFEQAHAIFDEVLPGSGSIFERRIALRRKYELPPEKLHLLPMLLERTMNEVRQRTQEFVRLPEQEGMDIQLVKDKHYGGACWYLGNYRSRIDVNTDLPMSLNTLPYFVSHEGYPGHHTESVLKEQHLYRNGGDIDQSIVLLSSPHCLISEGIATTALEMIFAPGEVDAWLGEHIYPEAGIEPDNVDTMKLHKASELLEDVWDNAAFMLHDGYADAEVMRYMQRYLLVPEEEVHKYLEFLKVPFQGAYVFTYGNGKRLMRPWLEGPDRLANFRRFLTEQYTPSDLVRG